MFESVKKDAGDKFREAFLAELATEAFDWDQLITSILMEQSPLQDILSPKTLALADIYAKARILHESVAEFTELEKTQQGE